MARSIAVRMRSSNPDALDAAEEAEVTDSHSVTGSRVLAESHVYSDSRTPESRLAETRLAETRLAESRLSESRLAESRLNESRLNESRLTESRLTEPRLTDTSLTSAGAFEEEESSARLITPPSPPAAKVAYRAPAELVRMPGRASTEDYPELKEDNSRYSSRSWRTEAWERERERELRAAARLRSNG
jgi:hypothetical protein